MMLLILFAFLLGSSLCGDASVDGTPANAALVTYLQDDLNTLSGKIADKKKEVEDLKAKVASLDSKRKAATSIGVVGKTAEGDQMTGPLAESAYLSAQVDLRRAQGELDGLQRDQEKGAKQLAAQQEAQDTITALRQQVSDLTDQSQQDGSLAVLLSDDEASNDSSGNTSDELLSGDS